MTDPSAFIITAFSPVSCFLIFCEFNCICYQHHSPWFFWLLVFAYVVFVLFSIFFSFSFTFSLSEEHSFRGLSHTRHHLGFLLWPHELFLKSEMIRSKLKKALKSLDFHGQIVLLLVGLLCPVASHLEANCLPTIASMTHTLLLKCLIGENGTSLFFRLLSLVSSNSTVSK